MWEGRCPARSWPFPFSMTIQFSSCALADAIMAGQRSGRAPGGGVEPPLAGLESAAQAAGPGKQKRPLRLGGASAYSDCWVRLREGLPIAFGRLPLAIERGHARGRQCPSKMLLNSIGGESHVFHSRDSRDGSQAFVVHQREKPAHPKAGRITRCGIPDECVRRRKIRTRRPGGGHSPPPRRDRHR